MPSSTQFASSHLDLVERPTIALRHVRSVVRRVSLSALAAAARDQDANFVRAIYCHYVFDDQREKFRELILSLKQLGEFVTTDTLLDMASGTAPVSGRYFHLSFDDGFANLYHNAAPILSELSVPAIAFVPTRMIGADEDVVRHYCLEVAKYRAVIPTLTWAQLGEMQACGFEVGSHTQSHARLADLAATDPDGLRSELAGSKADIEQSLSTECKYIAWPFGGLDDVDAASIRAIAAAGYRGCFGAFRGTVFPGVTSPFAIPRHHFEAEWPVAHVRYFATGHREY